MFEVWSDAYWTCWKFCYWQLCALIQFWSPALLQCDFCNLYVLLSVIRPCCLGCRVLIQRAVEGPSQMCCWGRAAKTCLLGHRGEGGQVVLLMGMSAEGKYMVIHTWSFPGVEKNTAKASVWLLKTKLFSTLWRYNTFSGSYLEKCLQPSLLGWCISPSSLSITEHFGFSE